MAFSFPCLGTGFDLLGEINIYEKADPAFFPDLAWPAFYGSGSVDLKPADVQCFPGYNLFLAREAGDLFL